MKINELTLGDIMKWISNLTAAPSSPSVNPSNADSHWVIGAIYLVRLVSVYDTGRLVKVTPQELVLEDAAWIADTGRFADALRAVEFSEVEPFPDGQVIIGRGAIVDAVQISKTQRNQK